MFYNLNVENLMRERERERERERLIVKLKKKVA